MNNLIPIIEQLGFKKRPKNEWVGYHDYIINEISGDIGYFLKATIHIPRMDPFYKIYLHRYLPDDRKIESCLKEGESELVFRGIIKDNFDLQDILRMTMVLP